MFRGSEKLNSGSQGGGEPAVKPSRDPLSGGKTSFLLALIIFAPISDAAPVKMAITAGRFRG